MKRLHVYALASSLVWCGTSPPTGGLAVTLIAFPVRHLGRLQRIILAANCCGPSRRGSRPGIDRGARNAHITGRPCSEVLVERLWRTRCHTLEKPHIGSPM